MRAQGATDADVEAYVRSIGGVEAERQTPTGVKSPEQIASLNAADVAAAKVPDGKMARVLGTASSLSKDIPGAEALQAFVASLSGGVPYREGLEMVRGAQASVPAPVRIGARLVGGGLAAMVAPGSTALRQGALLGATEGLARADEMSTGKRVGAGVVGGLLGGAAGKVAEQVGTGLRALRAPSAGQAALKRRENIAWDDAQLYGRADIEGLLTPSTPQMAHELTSQTVLPFAQRIRASETMLGASDADIAKETVKAMSDVQGKMLRQVEGTPEFLAGVRMNAKEIALAKERLIKGMETAMPTFPTAVKTHATGMQNLGSFKKGLDAARRAIGGKDVGGRKIEMESPEAFVKSVDKMTKDEALAAIEGVLGAVKRAPKLTSNVLSGFGVFSSAARTPLALMRVQPFLHALDKKAGTGAVARAFERSSIAATLPTSGLLR